MTNSTDALRNAWSERLRCQAQLRIAERALGRAVLTAARQGSELMSLPPIVLGDPIVRGALDAARLDPSVPHLHEGVWELADIIDLYVCGKFDEGRAVEILADWPYRIADPHRDEAQSAADTFAVLDAAGDAGLLPRTVIHEVRRRRSRAGERPHPSSTETTP